MYMYTLQEKQNYCLTLKATKTIQTAKVMESQPNDVFSHVSEESPNQMSATISSKVLNAEGTCKNLESIPNQPESDVNFKCNREVLPFEEFWNVNQLQASECSEDTPVRVTFKISEKSIVADCLNQGRVVGYLDLNESERCILNEGIIKGSAVLSIKKQDLILSNNRLSIRRIHEYRQESQPNHPVDMLSGSTNTERIQFSTTQPLMARYKDDVYFVGKHLQREYMNLLNQTNNEIGTALRINAARLFYRKKRQLDIRKRDVHSYEKILGIKPCDEWDCTLWHQYSEGELVQNSIRRFKISFKPFALQEVERRLILSSNYDNCMEIFAEHAILRLPSQMIWIQLYSTLTECSIEDNFDASKRSSSNSENTVRQLNDCDEEPPTSGSENDNMIVTFFKSKRRIVARAEHIMKKRPWRVGYLDLNKAERSQFHAAIESDFSEPITFNINAKELILDGKKMLLCIQRIEKEERMSNPVIALSDRSNTEHLLFSTAEPLMVRYRDTVYFVGERLQAEYMELLQRTKNEMGTTIRINPSLTQISHTGRKLDISKKHVGSCGCFIEAGDAYDNVVKSIYSKNAEFQRFMIDKPFALREIEPRLMQPYAVPLHSPDQFQIENSESDDNHEIDGNGPLSEIFQEDTCEPLTESESEIGDLTSDIAVSFRVSNGSIVAYLDYIINVLYKVDFIDLNKTELSILDEAIEKNFLDATLKIESKHLVFDKRMELLSIKRIEECPHNIQSEKSNTERIQFASTHPLLEMYKNSVHFAGQNVEKEYKDLLKRTTGKMGTALRINTARMIDFRRFIFSSETLHLQESDPPLMQFSVCEICTEIYVEPDIYHSTTDDEANSKIESSENEEDEDELVSDIGLYEDDGYEE